MPEINNINNRAYLDRDRTAELWTAVKTALAQKADSSDLSNYTTPDAVATAITSALTNYATNSGVQTAITTALTNYMTASAVNDAIVKAVTEAGHITFKVVTDLPIEGSPNIIYLIGNGKDVGNNIYEEYMWIDNKWEDLGNTEIDLSGYWNKNELKAMTSEELQAILV